VTRQAPLIGPAFSTYTPETFKQYVTGLYERPAGLSPVSGVKIIFGEKVTQVRFVKGKVKEIKGKDVRVLAEFYEKTEEELLELFKKRKIVIS